MIQQAEISGKLTKGKTIIEPHQEIPASPLAMIGSLKGYEVEIVMSSAVSVERRQMIKAFGRESALTDGKLGTDGRSSGKPREMVKGKPGEIFMPDQFSNEFKKNRPIYRTTGKKIWKQTKGEIGLFCFRPSVHRARLWCQQKY